jgi:hypothetical protein
MVCTNCKETVLKGRRSWGLHHQLKNLKESVATGCFICVQLDADIKEARLELDAESFTHRWTARMNTKTREQPTGFITITLRATVSSSVQPALPTRIFYLINENGPYLQRNRLSIKTDFVADIPDAPDPNQMVMNTESGLGQLDEWIKECKENHPRCDRAREQRMTEKPFIPTRLIELIGPGPEDGRLRLIETSEWSDEQSTKPYLTLSHCWGDPKVFSTYPSNVEEFLVSIELAKLPKTFENVMRLAWRLGISYVWIDSICVIQGPKGDFNIEAQLVTFG